MTGITGLHITKYLLRKTGVYFFLQMPGNRGRPDGRVPVSREFIDFNMRKGYKKRKRKFILREDRRGKRGNLENGREGYIW